LLPWTARSWWSIRIFAWNHRRKSWESFIRIVDVRPRFESRISQIQVRNTDFTRFVYLSLLHKVSVVYDSSLSSYNEFSKAAEKRTLGRPTRTDKRLALPPSPQSLNRTLFNIHQQLFGLFLSLKI
jgi:hypothetical protein